MFFFCFVSILTWRTRSIFVNGRRREWCVVFHLGKTFIGITQGHKSHQLNNHLNTTMMFLRIHLQRPMHWASIISDGFFAISSYFQSIFFHSLSLTLSRSRVHHHWHFPFFICNISLPSCWRESFRLADYRSQLTQTTNSKPIPFRMRMKYRYGANRMLNAECTQKRKKIRTKYYNGDKRHFAHRTGTKCWARWTAVRRTFFFYISLNFNNHNYFPLIWLFSVKMLILPILKILTNR